MVAVTKSPYITPQEYLERERAAQHKSEYFAGTIYAMSGASVAHNTICANLTGNLWAQFKGKPCRVFTSDMKVRVGTTGLYAYPDAVALCGEAHFDDRHRDVFLNPALIIEVLSPSTEAYDRGAKFIHYQHLTSLTDYVLISQDRFRLERYQRQTDRSWRYTCHEDSEEVVRFAALDCELRLADIYDKVEFPTLAEENLRSTEPGG